MEKLKKLFFGIDFTWKKVIIFAISTAVVVAILNLIPALEGTSFTDPAATADVWYLFAVIIIMNCNSYKEAALKTFIFFVISQPLIYLIEVPFVDLGWKVFRYYPYWAKLTVATLPGACLAYRVKKNDVISALILSIATSSLMCMVTYYYFDTDPVHVISMIFCGVLSAVFILTLLSEKKERIITTAITLVCFAIFTISLANPEVPCHPYILDDSHEWTITSENDDGIKAQVCDGSRLEIYPYEDGKYLLTLEDEEGNVEELMIHVSDDAASVDIYESK